ncbi:protein-disulfide reductase DsbD family protein [Zavarzinia sp.]|uniref:protein-disulfide reductase DsbD family protein n=1 Tax=Zavarzinia sp. TaxID=2027920 RepID=UPI003567AD75
MTRRDSRFNFAFLLFALVAALLMPLAARAGVKTENAEVELVADHAAVPGQSLTVALRLVARPGWHTYWLNPGDTGLATTIAWSLPEGVTAGPIQWPFPEAIPVGPLVNYGYEGETWLLTEVTVPTGFQGPVLSLKARADWLICETICVPEGADLSLDVPVAAGAAEPNAGRALGFERARDRLPLPLPASAVAIRHGAALRLTLPAEVQAKSAHFFPEDDAVAAATPQNFTGDSLEFALDSTYKGSALKGIVVVANDGWRRAYVVDAALPPAPAAASPPAAAVTAPAPAPDLGLWLALGFAFLGGLILNLMPCVLPVLSIKLLSLARSGEAGHAQRHGIAYTLGVLVCFSVLAGVLIALRAGGEAIGWGFQLQSPLIVGLLAYLFFALGLWLLDVISTGSGLMGLGDGLARRGGVLGSFSTGLLAAVVATPCSAPFMGAALGFALTRPIVEAYAIFLFLGLGLSSPFLAVALVPALGRRLPKPGAWMVRLKRLLAFPMFASCVWLVWVLAVQAGPMAVAAAGGGILLIAFAAFLVREFAGGGARMAAFAAVLVALGLAGMPVGGLGTSEQGLAAAAGAEAYSPARLAELRAAGKPVFVNLTAAWCITCLVNEKVALERPAVKKAMEETGTVYMVGDWTNRDPEISRLLTENGRSGVPLYLLFPAGSGAPRVLPQLLTEGLVAEAIGHP